MKEDYSLTPKEVAEILNIKKNTVYELIKRGDLAAYRIGRKLRIEYEDVEAYKRRFGNKTLLSETSLRDKNLTSQSDIPVSTEGELIICGLDILLDVLTRHLENHPQGVKVYRNHVGSFPGLMALYDGKASMAGIHLWDADSKTYNIPYVRRLLPGIPTVIIHLAVRQQGFYVAKGNPLEITKWEDLARPGLRLVNREPGCGTRVLLDEQLRILGINRLSIEGYQDEEYSHLAVASTIARGLADVGLGNQKAAMQVRNIDFVPLHKERYELVIKEQDMHKPVFQLVQNIINSQHFKDELQGLGDYELEETGQIVARV